MAPPTKIRSQAGFIYEKNKFVALVDKSLPNSQEFHNMMDFIKGSSLSYAMLTPANIYYEVAEEMWNSASFDEYDMCITFSINGEEVYVTCNCLKDCLQLPNDTVSAIDIQTHANVKTFLTDIGYNLEIENLGAIKKRGLRKE